MTISRPDPAEDRRVSFTDAFSSALRGAPAGFGRAEAAAHADLLPVHAWSGEATTEDEALLALCEGATIDLGCGPGRMAAALVRRGHRTLGVDVVEECVRLTRARGVEAVHGSLFETLPGEGSWTTALLADGNVGIGGDPVRLLERAAAILGPAGRVVVEVAGPGVRSTSRWMTLEVDGVACRPFRWAVLGTDDVCAVAVAAGLAVRSIERVGRRWVAVLDRGVEGVAGSRMVG
ncbi:class I SAM-dependent methyltransferase [Nocardioides bruguierae]|uniref:class I SAM-dependent methyltransferase n=1 Tax=Nocardioides bruguierae TaxID=2945102 RepID=UPI0020201B0C|nr:class I SAM-dependent methyltransferase [Nocardioides bruguierae]MCL8027322.1 class I SAM-dependent methyltransferase [Nocardioides bruguierae]